MINENLTMRVDAILTDISAHPGWLVSPFLVSTLIIDLWNKLIEEHNDNIRLRKIIQDMMYREI